MTDTEVSFSWRTDPASTCYVHYGEDKARLHNQAVSIGPVTNHRIRIPGLSPGTLYYYYIESSTPVSNAPPGILRTPIGSFRTTGEPRFRIISCEAVSNLKDRFVLVWSATRPASVSVHYVEDGKSERKTVSSEEFSLSGNLQVTGLRPGRAYLYAVALTDKTGKTIRESVKKTVIASENIAFSRPVSGTFTNFIDNDPFFDRSGPALPRITDGLTSFFKGTAVSGNLTESAQFCVIDLSEIRSLTRVEVVWRSLSVSTNFDLESSTDGTTWKKIAGSLNGLKGTPGRSENGDPLLTITAEFSASPTRYLRLTARKGSARNKHRHWTGVQLAEIRAFE